LRCFRKNKFSAENWARDRIDTPANMRDRRPHRKPFESKSAQHRPSPDGSYAERGERGRSLALMIDAKRQENRENGICAPQFAIGANTALFSLFNELVHALFHSIEHIHAMMRPVRITAGPIDGHA
jgi:hypothetical protein